MRIFLLVCPPRHHFSSISPQLSFPVFKCRVQMGPAVKSELGRLVSQLPTSFITWSPGGGRGWGGLGSSIVFQKVWHVRTQIFFGHPSPLSPAVPVIAGLAQKLTVAAQGTAAASVCTNGKENVHGGLWATQSNWQCVVLRKTTLEGQKMENRTSIACKDWASS